MNKEDTNTETISVSSVCFEKKNLLVKLNHLVKTKEKWGKRLGSVIGRLSTFAANNVFFFLLLIGGLSMALPSLTVLQSVLRARAM